MTRRQRFLTVSLTALALVGVIAHGLAAPPPGKGKAKLALTVDPASIAETAGPDAATGTVTHNNADLGSAVLVTLSSSDPTEATVPAGVTISAGSNSATFPIDAVDDSDLDGNQTVTITATAADYRSATADLTVEDDDSSPPTTQPSYSITLLGTLGGPDSEAWAMNESGDVIGKSHTADGTWVPFVYFSDTNEMVDLRDLLTPEDRALWRWDYFFTPRGINSGLVVPKQICGSAPNLDDGQSHAIRITLPQEAGDTAIVEIVSPDISVGSVARDINEVGEVTGFYKLPGEIVRGFVYSDLPVPQWQDIGDLGGILTNPIAINNFGVITGEAENADGERRAFRFIPGEAMQDLGVIKKVGRVYSWGNSSYGADLNDLAVVVGISIAGMQSGEPVKHAFREAGAGMDDLGTLDGDSDSSATGINFGGTIVGWSDGGDYGWRGFLYSDEFGMLELDSLIDKLPADTVYIAARNVMLQINDAGKICGTILHGELGDRTAEAYVLTPN